MGQVQYELGELTTEIITRLRYNWFFVGHDDTLRFLDSGKPWDSVEKKAERLEDEHDDDLGRLEVEFGLRLSMEEYDGSTRSRSDRFHQEEISYNRTRNCNAIARFEESAGRKPTSKADVALARELMAYEDLDGALATEHYLDSRDRYSGEHTPVSMTRKIQEMCSQKISTLRSQLAAPQSYNLEGQANAVPQDLNSVIAETGYLVFKAPCASFTVHTNLAHEFTDKRSIYPFGVYNARGTRVGEVVLNSNDQPPPPQAEFVVLCKQHPHPKLALTPEREEERESSEAWSIMRDMKYGVLMIERRNDIAHRIGQGTISVPKWDQEDSVEKLIVLG